VTAQTRSSGGRLATHPREAFCHNGIHVAGERALRPPRDTERFDRLEKNRRQQ